VLRRKLARQIDVPVNRVTAIINGQRAITADTALRLGHWFGTSPEFWLNLQKLYELRLARREVGNRVDRLPRLTNHKRKKGNDAPRLILFVVYTDRGDARHIISAPLANSKERRLWQSFAEQWKISAE
jgi:antitoxin HigA-1